MTTMVLSLGSLFTEGAHLYIDDGHPLKLSSLNILMEALESLEVSMDAKMIVLRDFKL